MQIDQGGAIDAASAARRQDDIRARLAAGAVKLEDAAGAAEVKPASDFYSKEEMAQVGSLDGMPFCLQLVSGPRILGPDTEVLVLGCCC